MNITAWPLLSHMFLSEIYMSSHKDLRVCLYTYVQLHPLNTFDVEWVLRVD
jgi:hypothetical protein